MRRGASLYARLQARLRRQQYALEGRCQCGHERDRAKSDGSLFLQCCACFNRQQRRQAKAKGDNAELRVLEPMPPTRVHGRHDGAALPSVGVQLQTLRAVKDQWIACRNVGAFGKWLLSQIESLERISSPESLTEAPLVEQAPPR